MVKADPNQKGGIIRIDFRKIDKKLKPIKWEGFFEIFKKNNFAFLY